MQNETPLDLAERIKQLRRRRGISQEDLANALNVSRQAVSKWESGQTQPELEKLLTLSEFFQVSADYLLKGSEPAKPQTPPLPAPQAEKQPSSRQLFLINATLFNYIGLLLGWALWDYYQLTICTFVSLAMSLVGAGLLAAGLSCTPKFEERRRLWRSFWRWNIWPIAQLIIGVLFSALSSGGVLISPTINIFFFGWTGPGLFVFGWGAWLIVCLTVGRKCRIQA